MNLANHEYIFRVFLNYILTWSIEDSLFSTTKIVEFTDHLLICKRDQQGSHLLSKFSGPYDRHFSDLSWP